jgi:4-methyl-5(b-hydroxyethyl)-thiazole monophosphate biosynthesis
MTGWTVSVLLSQEVNMPTRALITVADGVEDLECVTLIDVLRRAEIEVVVASIEGRRMVTCARGTRLTADTMLVDVLAQEFDLIVLPGGMPGAQNLKADERVLALVRALESSGRAVAAICAAPIVLAEAGVLHGRRATAYPSFRDRLADAEVVAEPRVVRSGPVITSQGVGTALEFALELASDLAGPARAQELRAAMLVG